MRKYWLLRNIDLDVRSIVHKFLTGDCNIENRVPRQRALSEIDVDMIVRVVEKRKYVLRLHVREVAASEVKHEIFHLLHRVDRLDEIVECVGSYLRAVVNSSL